MKQQRQHKKIQSDRPILLGKNAVVRIGGVEIASFTNVEIKHDITFHGTCIDITMPGQPVFYDQELKEQRKNREKRRQEKRQQEQFKKELRKL